MFHWKYIKRISNTSIVAIISFADYNQYIAKTEIFNNSQFWTNTIGIGSGEFRVKS